MPRIAVILGLGLSLAAGQAVAERASASFSAGITIGKKVKPPHSATYTWGAAAIAVSAEGYHDITRETAGEGLYWFTARKGNSLFRIAVSARSGAIVEVNPA